MKLKLINSIVISLAAICAFSSSSALAMNNFASAKKELPKVYYQIEQQTHAPSATVYCGCPVTVKKSGRNYKWQFDVSNCDYTPRKNAKRANRIEAEHVMPAWEFGHQLKCWINGGRKNCQSDSTFDKMEGDLHNLYPSVGEVNGDRANFQYSDWNGKPTQYGQCQMVIDFKGKRAQPPKMSRGMLARAYLYMADQYNIKLSNQQRRLYEAWDKMYKADKVECLRNELIAKVQGNENKFITQSCKL